MFKTIICEKGTSLTQHKRGQEAWYLIDASKEEEPQEDRPGRGEGQSSSGDTKDGTAAKEYTLPAEP